LKKLFLLLTAFALVFGLSACKEEEDPTCTDTQELVDGVCEDIVVNVDPTISGVEDVSLFIGNAFDQLEGVSATDEEDGNLTSSITVSGSVDLTVPGSYTLTYNVTDTDGSTTTVTRTVVVAEAAEVYQTGFFDYKFETADIRHTFMAAAEKYLMNNMYAGVPLFSNGGLNLYSSRLQLPVENYVAVMGFGTRFATMSSDDSTVKMDDNEFGNAGEFTYRTRISENPQTFNQWIYDTSTDSTLMSEYYGALYDYIFNADKTGYEVVPAMAAADPEAVDPEVTDSGKTISKVWRISLKDGLLWTYHDDTDLSALPAGHEVIDANDFVNTYKKALEEGWFRAISGGGDFVTSAQSVVGAGDYYDLWDDPTDPYDWADVGIKAIDNLTIEFTFEDDQSTWNVKYWLASFVMAPVNLELMEVLGDDFATDETTIAYHGPYVLDYYEDSKILRFVKNPNYAMPNWDFYTHKTFIVQQDPAITFAEFEAGKLEAVGLPTESYETYKDDPRLKRAPGVTTYRMMINGLGTVEAQREQFPSGSWIPEPILANQDFKMAMFFAIDRKYLAEDVLKTRTTNMFLFSDGYLVEAESGVPYRNTPQGVTVGEGLSPSSNGYNKDAATALFKQAVAALIAEGVLVAGADADNPTIITLEFNYFANSDSQVTMYNYIRDAFEEAFVDDVNFVEVRLEGFAKQFPAIYYDYMMTGEFDLSIGGISGSALDAASFLDTYSSDNRSGFTLNWGIDTSVAEIPVVYNDSEGVRHNEVWSFDAIVSILNGEVYVIDGEEAEVPAAKDIEYTPTTITFTVDKFNSASYQDFTYTLQTYNASTGAYDDVPGHVDVPVLLETTTITGIAPGYDDYPTKYVGDYQLLISYVYAEDTEKDGTSTSAWWMQPSTVADATEANTLTALDVTLVLDDDFDSTVASVKLLDGDYADTAVVVTVAGLQLTASGLTEGTVYVFEITYADGTVDYYYTMTEAPAA
jgi:ABC-type oligopeptide transport system substrate-binding subunit